MKTKGWQKIFSFTIIQYLKSKSFIIGEIVMCAVIAVICVLTNILPVIMSDDFPGQNPDDTNNGLSALEAVYIYDDENILTSEDKDIISGFVSCEVTYPAGSVNEVVEKLKTNDILGTASEIVCSRSDDGKIQSIEVRTYYSPDIDKDAADSFSETLRTVVNRRNMLKLGVASENYEETQISIYSSVFKAGSTRLNMIQSIMNYFIPMALSLVLFILIFSCGQMVAQSIATEKTSRVMELLLTSVRPLAVVIGKVLAMGLACVGQFFVIGIVGGLSFAISAPFGWIGKTASLAADPEMLQSIADSAQNMDGDMQLQMAQALNDLKTTLNPFNLLLIFICFVLGFLFFALIAALVGASVSRMEDLNAAMQPFALLGVLGVYLAYFPVIFDMKALETGEASTNPIQIFSYFFPVSAPFSLPSAIVLGTLNTWQALLAVIILAAAVVLIAVIVGKVYEAIILHNGNRIKLSDILKMAARR